MSNNINAASDQTVSEAARTIFHDDVPDMLEVPIDLRRNKLAFGFDSALWGIGISFMPLATVLTSLAAKLTPDKTLIGLLSLAWYVGYLLPQLFAARLLRGKARMRMYSVLPSLIARPVVLAFALWLAITRAADPTLTFWLLIGMVVVMMIFDAVTSVAWFDMMGRALSPRVRARTIAVNQFVAAVAGLGVGVLVERILGSAQLPFPLNYALLLGMAWLFYELSLVAMLFIKERAAQQTSNPQTPNLQTSNVQTSPSQPHPSFIHALKLAWRTDANFKLMLIVRALTSVENMAAAFYVVFARERLGLPDSSVGVFTIAYIAGGLLGTVLFGWLAERFGPLRVINAASVMQFSAPALGFVLSFMPVTPALSTLIYVFFILMMLLNGAVNRSVQVGFFSYAQDSAHEADRPMYVGAVSTVAGTASFLPVLGGAMIDLLTRLGFVSGAYSLLFGVAAITVGLGLWLSLRLPKPRRV